MRSFLFAFLFTALAATAQVPEPLFNLVSLDAQAEREIPNDLLTATLAAEAEGTESAPQPALEPGSTRILVSVSGTIQLQ